MQWANWSTMACILNEVWFALICPLSQGKGWNGNWWRDMVGAHIDWFVISSFAVHAISSVISIIQSKACHFSGWLVQSQPVGIVESCGMGIRPGARTQSGREQATGLYIKFVPKFIAIACRPTITQYFKDPSKLSVPSSLCSGMETQTSTRYFPMMVVSSL